MVDFYQFYYHTKSLLLWMKCVFKHQDLQIVINTSRISMLHVFQCMHLCFVLTLSEEMKTYLYFFTRPANPDVETKQPYFVLQ